MIWVDGFQLNNQKVMSVKMVRIFAGNGENICVKVSKSFSQDLAKQLKSQSLDSIR